MGTAWANSLSYPWEHGYYVGGIETVKVNIMLRIYANQWHVYAGLAILNPSARTQIDQYSKSSTELLKLVLMGDRTGLMERGETLSSVVCVMVGRRGVRSFYQRISWIGLVLDDLPHQKQQHNGES